MGPRTNWQKPRRNFLPVVADTLVPSLHPKAGKCVLVESPYLYVKAYTHHFFTSGS